ncbi:MAG: tol-pal system YbgF family protein [Bdellovibrionales bacterium]
MFKILIKICILSALLSCSFFKKEDDNKKPELSLSQKITKEQRGQVRKLLNLYREGKHEDVVKKTKKFFNQHQTSIYNNEVHLLRGKSFLALDEVERALKEFRNSEKLWAKNKKGRLISLYYIGVCHEKLGEDQKLIADLLSLDSKPRLLKSDIYELEIPARLSAAYSREGNIQVANRYFERANKYLSRYIPNKKLPETQKKLVGRMLFEIGNRALFSNDQRDFDSRLKSIEYSQIYFLRAIELGASPFAEKASDYLLSEYRELLDSEVKGFMQLYNWRNQVEAAKRQIRVRKNLNLFRAGLVKLNLQDLPVEILDSDLLKDLRAAVYGMNQELDTYLLARDVGQGLTDQAKKELGLRIKSTRVRPKELMKKYEKELSMPLEDPNL